MRRHLHIVACSPRSGTTLLHEVMITCFEHTTHYDHEVRFNRVALDGEGILITKRPKDVHCMLPLLQQIDEFAVIFVLRDPRDVIVSRHGKDTSRYYSNVRLWNEMYEAAFRLRGQKNFIELKYEDFVREPDRIQQVIMKRFPWLKKKYAFSDYHEHAQVSEASARAMHGARPIDSGSVGVWTDHCGRIKGQQMIHGSLTPRLVECGYESNGDWERCLTDVGPDLAPSYYPERKGALAVMTQRLSQAIKIRRYLTHWKRTQRHDV